MLEWIQEKRLKSSEAERIKLCEKFELSSNHVRELQRQLDETLQVDITNIDDIADDDADDDDDDDDDDVDHYDIQKDESDVEE